MELMARAQRYLPPVDICNKYESLGGGHRASVIEGLWDTFGDATAKCIADGARTLGQLWQAAYDLNPQSEFSGEISQDVSDLAPAAAPHNVASNRRRIGKNVLQNSKKSAHATT